MTTSKVKPKEDTKKYIDKDHSENGFRVDRSGVMAPTRAMIAEAMAQAGTPLTFAQLAETLFIDGKKSKKCFKAMEERIQRMLNAGQVIKNRNGQLLLSDKLGLISGHILAHSNGYGFLSPETDEEDVFLPPAQMRRVLHGDRVLVQIKERSARGLSGRIVELIEPGTTQIVGRLRKQSGAWFVAPDNPKFTHEMLVKNKIKAKAGQMVVAKVTAHPISDGHLGGHIVEVLGDELCSGMRTDVAIRQHAIPHEWPQKVEQQIKDMGAAIKRVDAKGDRVDLRALPLMTIDGEDAKDFDDAVYAEKAGRDFRLIVAIADVSHYVTPFGALDEEALNRGNSVYFPDRVVPMLPEQLSNGICSLRPDVDRFCMVCDMRVSSTGKVKKYTFYAAVMRSCARLTYTDANAILTEGFMPKTKTHQEIVPALQTLYDLFGRLHKQRGKRGALDFDFPESGVVLNDSGDVTAIVKRERNVAHTLIEECMLAANVCAAEFLAEHYQQSVFRNHAGPKGQDLVDLRKTLGALHLNLTGGKTPRAPDFAEVIKAASIRDDINAMVQLLLLRSLGQARYSVECHGHFALNYDSYTHFTSPIRRYPDLIVHRMIKAALAKTKPKHTTAQLLNATEHSSFTERRAEEATREVVAGLKAEFMQDKTGQEFNAKISGVTAFGVFVQLKEILVEGLVHVSNLGNDYFEFDPVKYCMMGQRSGIQFRIGDLMQVSLASVDADSGKMDFVPVAMPSNKSAGKKADKLKRRPNKKRGK